jgi:hypothetical protein
MEKMKKAVMTYQSINGWIPDKYFKKKKGCLASGSDPLVASTHTILTWVRRRT